VIPAPFKVVLDACVLYPFTVRDVLLEAAAHGFYQVYWSETILDEALRNLISDRRMTEDQAAKLVAVMRRAFPEAQVTDYEALIPSMRNDEKDRHVAAAAVKAGAQVIVTSNTRDFYDLPSGIDVQTPDDFLCNLFDLDPPHMMGVLETVARRYRKPPMEIPRIVKALALVGFGELVRAQLTDASRE
jgi:predicted nucleic acid-binding protein